MVHHNRKSHLILPQNSPSAADLPRVNGSGSSGFSNTQSTPTLMDVDQHMSALSIDSNSTPTESMHRPYPARTSSANNVGGLAFRQAPTSSGVSNGYARQAPSTINSQYDRTPTASNSYYQPTPPQGPLPALPRKESQQY